MSPAWIRSSLLHSVMIGCAVLAPCITIAQSSAASDSPPSVSIPDSPAAVERIDKAREKELQKQWKTAAEYYQEALTKYARRVVPVKIDKNAGIFQYIGVSERVQERLAKWPEEGLEAYRSAYGKTAADLLASTGRDDLATLENIFQTYFITDAGKSAGIRLMDAHLEAGRFYAAAWIGEKLLSLHPSLEADRGEVIFRTALAYHWSGDSTKATKLLDELKASHSNETGAIGGKDAVLTDALTTAIRLPPIAPATQPTDADHWPTFGGPDGRGEISSSSAKPGASLHSIPLLPPSISFIQPQQKLAYDLADQQDLAAGQGMGIVPVADGGALFFQDGRHIYAVNADSGQPLPGWSESNGAAGTYSIDAFGRARGEQLTLTVTSNRVLAIMGQMDRQALLVPGVATPSVRVVCLDRANGKAVWTRSPGDLPVTVAPLRTAEYNGTPMVVGDDSVLLIARGGKANEFEDCYVVCLSLKSGDYKWCTYIGSASRIIEGEIGMGLQCTSEMSFADGRVFVLSNLGTVAALDPIDGRMIWLNSYPRDVSDNPAAMMMMRNRVINNGATPVNKPWTNNPVVVSGGKVFVLPAQGRELLVYDAGTGEETRRIAVSDYDNSDVLLGVRDHAVVLTSDKFCYCIDWTGYDRENPNNAILWDKQVIADPVAGQENAVWGRGFLTNDSVFIPTKHRLVQLSWFKSGRLTSTYPSRGVWPGTEEPGNVLVTSQNVIVAGSRQISVYTDLELLRRQFQQRIAANPQDPAARIWFAEVLFSSSATEALSTLDEAIEIAGGLGKMRHDESRRQIFETALRFAQQSASENTPQSAVIAEKCFDRTASAADSPHEQADYRLARANYDQIKKDYVGAVALCQEILSDPALRSVILSENSTAASQAESEIADTIVADRASYAAVEQSAGVALDAARKSSDPQKLLAVGLVYPNSSAAVEARQAAAGLFETQGDHHAAIQTLMQMYAAANDAPVKARLLEAVARNFLVLPDGIGPAIDRLACGAQLVPSARLSQPLVLSNGATIAGVPFTDAITTLRKIESAKESAKLPSFHLAVPKSAKDKVLSTTDASVISDVRVLVPLPGEFARSDRLVTWSGTEISIFAAGATTPMGSTALSDEPVGAAWMNQNLLVWTANHILLLNDAASEKWKAAPASLATLAIASDTDAVTDDAPDSAEANGNTFIFAGRGGPMAIVGPGQVIFRNGRAIRLLNNGLAIAPAPVARAKGEKIAGIRPAGERIIVTTSSGRIAGLDAGDGRVAWQMQLTDGPIAQLLANPHFTVARLNNATGAQLIVLDTETGQVIGRRKFGPDDSGNQLVNAALSEEGLLAFTLTNRLMVKELYDQWKKRPVDLTGRPDADPPSFAGMNQPDQLLIHSGHVLALYDSGKFVRVQDLASAEGAGNPLATGADSATVSLRLVGPQLFIQHPKNMARYNLTDANDHQIPPIYDIDFPPRITEMMLGQDYTLLVDDPVDRGPAGSPFVRLLAFGRFPGSPEDPRESDRLQDDPLISNANGILSWQRVDGGVYYLSEDHKLHLLKSVQ